jgi:hypothetical protein
MGRLERKRPRSRASTEIVRQQLNDATFAVEAARLSAGTVDPIRDRGGVPDGTCVASSTTQGLIVSG